MLPDRLTTPQLHALVTHSDDILRAADLLQSLVPAQWQIPVKARKLCDRAASENGRYITEAETIRVFAGFLRACPALGPNSQEQLRYDLECVIERMGLTEAVTRATTPERASASRG